MGYRPRRASIAERVLLTKRKMEEVKEAFVHLTTNVPKTTALSAETGFQHAASKSTGSPGSISTPMTSPVITKQPLPNGTVAGGSCIKPDNIPSIVSLLPVGSADVKVEKCVNGSNFTQSGAVGAETIDQANKSYHSATGSHQNSVPSSSQAGKPLGKNAPTIHPVKGSIVMGHQAPSGDLSVQKQSIFSNHKAIANKVEWILHQPFDRPKWTVPSTKFMNARLDCQMCKVSISNVESLLVCDACERGVHLKCLQRYGNQGLPIAEWYCPTCVAHSNGKSLPPKYGKVTRTIVAPKTTATSGVTQTSSLVAAENPTEKDNCKKEATPVESVINGNFNNAGCTVHKSGTLALDTTSPESLSISAVGPQKGSVKNDETSSMEEEENGQPSSVILEGITKSCNEVQSSEASTHDSGNVSGRSRIHIESTSMNSVMDASLQSTVLCGLKPSDPVSSVDYHESAGTSHQHPRKNVQSVCTGTQTDEIHRADGVASNGIGKPHEQEIITDDASLDHGSAHQVNGHIFPEREIVGDHKHGYAGCSTARVVDWVGDALKAFDDKTYYNSCNINGVIYNLHDHVFIASEGSKSGPCKLQSLWEEHDSGSRLAMVNPYFLGSDIPESISTPCADDEREVYGSNNERIVLVSAICGPCEVLSVGKYREETKRRCQLDNSGSRLYPIFFCRWKYDESTSSFYKDYNVDS